ENLMAAVQSELAASQVDTSFAPTRRQVLHVLGALGIGSAVFQRALSAQVEQALTVTPEMIQQAEWIAGLQLSEEDRKTTAQGVHQTLRDCAVPRRVKRGTQDSPRR